jgi:hypothetical protein
VTGVFDLPKPPNLIGWDGVGTDTSIDGAYDSGLQQGHFLGAPHATRWRPPATTATRARTTPV